MAAYSIFVLYVYLYTSLHVNICTPVSCFKMCNQYWLCSPLFFCFMPQLISPSGLFSLAIVQEVVFSKYRAQIYNFSELYKYQTCHAKEPHVCNRQQSRQEIKYLLQKGFPKITWRNSLRSSWEITTVAVTHSLFCFVWMEPFYTLNVVIEQIFLYKYGYIIILCYTRRRRRSCLSMVSDLSCYLSVLFLGLSHSILSKHQRFFSLGIPLTFMPLIFPVVTI